MRPGRRRSPAALPARGERGSLRRKLADAIPAAVGNQFAGHHPGAADREHERGGQIAGGVLRADSANGDDRKLDETRYERMKPDFHARLSEAYQDIVRREPARCVLVDGTKPVEAVSEAIREAVSERLGIGLR